MSWTSPVPRDLARRLRQIQLHQTQAVFERRQVRLQAPKHRLGLIGGRAGPPEVIDLLSLFLQNGPSALDQLAGSLNFVRLFDVALLRSGIGRVQELRASHRSATKRALPFHTVGRNAAGVPRNAGKAVGL